MTRYERREFFERMVALRDRYGRLGRLDDHGEMRVGDAMTWASRALGTASDGQVEQGGSERDFANGTGY